ncbi:MAG: SPASM domain-containing protein [Lentisphaeria bacterium]|nr:SPASM domain-containing protein [Lentisphaeria bacterium]
MDARGESYDSLLDQTVDRLNGKPTNNTYNPFWRTVSALTAGRQYPDIGCGICRNDQGVDVDGRLYPCHRYVGMESYVIGNVHSGPDLNAARRGYERIYATWFSICSDCWARYICNGSCPWQGAHSDGTQGLPRPATCASVKRSIHRSAYLANLLAREPLAS